MLSCLAKTYHTGCTLEQHHSSPFGRVMPGICATLPGILSGIPRELVIYRLCVGNAKPCQAESEFLLELLRDPQLLNPSDFQSLQVGEPDGGSYQCDYVCLVYWKL